MSSKNYREFKAAILSTFSDRSAVRNIVYREDKKFIATDDWSGKAVADLCDYCTKPIDLMPSIKKTLELLGGTTEDRHLFVVFDHFDERQVVGIKQMTVPNALRTNLCFFHFIGIGNKYTEKVLKLESENCEWIQVNNPVEAAGKIEEILKDSE